MAVTFVLGRAGTGKTRYCLDAVAAALAEPGTDRRLLLLVPEQASFQMERALGLRAPGGGFWRAEVLSFSRLARRILDQTGPTPTLVDATARRMALHLLTGRMLDQLRTLRRAARTPGFVTELDRLIDELLREDVRPEMLRDVAARLEEAAAARKAHDLATLYEAYIAWLGTQQHDAADRLSLACARIPGVTWLQAASIWVDGFAGFTGQEFETLAALARQARDVSITLLVDPASPSIRNPRHTPDELGLFCRTERTYQRLNALFAEAGADVRPPVELTPAPPPRFASAPALAHMEAVLATPIGARPAEAPAHATPQDQALRVLECGSHRDELCEAARWIRATIIDAGSRLRFSDFAVVARDLEPFASLVAEVFESYEIPYFLDRRRPLHAHPLMRILPTLLEVAQTDCDVRAMVRLLRTRLVPLDNDVCEQLENIVVRENIRGLHVWQAPAWLFLQSGEQDPAFAEARRELVACLLPLLHLANAPAPPSGTTWARMLFDVLERLGVLRHVSNWMHAARTHRAWERAEAHRQAWDAVCSMLDHLAGVFGSTPLTLSDVRTLLDATYGQTLALPPPAIDQVLVSSIERSRHPDIQHVWLFGFNEGVFPAPPADDVLLSTADRDALRIAGLPGLRCRRDDIFGERLLAYIAFTRPSRSLTISYAAVADDGDQALPSPLVAEIRQAFPDLRIARPDRMGPPAHLIDLAEQMLAATSDGAQPTTRRRYDRLGEAVAAVPSLAGRLSWLLRGRAYHNHPEPVGNFRRPASLPGVAWETSPSEVETALQCPFRHFATYGLRLDPMRGPRPLRWDLGSLAHEFLADVTRAAAREPGGVTRIPPGRWAELIADATARHRVPATPELLARRPDYVAMTEVLLGRLAQLVRVHAERWRRGDFEPAFCEEAFDPLGRRGAFRAASIDGPSGERILLRGKIDRVDAMQRAGESLLLLYDYKSANVGPVRTAFLTGHRLQLFLYLLALRQCGLGTPVGAFLAPLVPSAEPLETAYAREADAMTQWMYMLRPRGLLCADVAEHVDRDVGATSSPVANLRKKKDGGYYANCDVCTHDLLDACIALAEQTVLYAAGGVTRGAIDVAPLVEQKTLACRTCEYQAVCRFDRMYNRPRPAERTLPTRSGADAHEEGEA